MLSLFLTVAFAQDGADTSSTSSTSSTDDCASKKSDTCDSDEEVEYTLEIDGTEKGSLEVQKGDVVLLTGEVTHDVFVSGGVLVIDGGTIGRDLEITGGEVDLVDAVIDRDLAGDGGELTLGDVDVSRDFILVGTTYISSDGTSLVTDPGQGITKGGRITVGRDFDLIGDLSRYDVIEMGGTIDAGRDINIDADVSVTISGTVSAGGDISVDAGSDGSVGAPAAAFISSSSGMVNLFNSNAAKLGGTIEGPDGVTISTEAPMTLSATIDWGRKGYSQTNDGEELACGAHTYYPTLDKPKVDYWKCL